MSLAPDSQTGANSVQVDRVLLPFWDESLDGYVARVAAAEFLPRSIDITALAGVAFANRPELSRCQNDELRIVAKALGIDWHLLAARGSLGAPNSTRVDFFGASVDRRMFGVRTRRFAPQLLATSGYHRAVWALRPFPFCDVSWTYLLENCAGCDATQRWHHTVGIDLCDKCGEPLSRATSEPVPHKIRANLRLAAGLVHPSPKRRAETNAELPAELSTIEPGELLDLLSAVAGMVDPRIRLPSARHLIDGKASPTRIARAVALAWPILTGWPDSFHDFASKRLAMRTGRFCDGNGGATRNFLFLPFAANVMPSVAHAITALRQQLVVNADKGYTPRKAASLARSKTTALVRERRLGHIPTIIVLTGDRIIPLLEKEAVDKIAASGASITYYAVAAQLGVTHRAVEELVAEGHLLIAHAEPGRSNIPRISRTSLEQFTHRIRSGATLDRGYTSLRQAMKIVGGRLKPWLAVFDALLSGSLSYSIKDGDRPLSELIAITAQSRSALLELPDYAGDTSSFSTMMSKREAIEALNLHLRHSTAALNQWPSAKAPVQTVPLDTVVATAHRHIYPTEASLRLGVRPHHVRSVMNKYGVELLSVAGYDRVAAFNRIPELRLTCSPFLLHP